jgi:amidase
MTRLILTVTDSDSQPPLHTGTGTAIAASFAVIGIGSDTNGSIQNPAAVQSLAGLRPSLGLVSSVGVFPLLDWQDVAGPMTRTVKDLAYAMEVCARNHNAAVVYAWLILPGLLVQCRLIG